MIAVLPHPGKLIWGKNVRADLPTEALFGLFDLWGEGEVGDAADHEEVDVARGIGIAASGGAEDERADDAGIDRAEDCVAEDINEPGRFLDESSEVGEDRALGIGLEVGPVAVPAGEQDARGVKLGQFSLETGGGCVEVAGEVARVPPLRVMHECGPEDGLADSGEEGIEGMGNITHNA